MHFKFISFFLTKRFSIAQLLLIFQYHLSQLSHVHDFVSLLTGIQADAETVDSHVLEKK